MSESQLTEATKSLLEAAKAEGPTAAARAKIWDGVATATKIAGAAAPLAGAASGASVAAGTGKVVSFATLLGGAVTVGLAIAFLKLGPVVHEPPPIDVPVVAAGAPSLVVAPVVVAPVAHTPGDGVAAAPAFPPAAPRPIARANAASAPPPSEAALRPAPKPDTLGGAGVRPRESVRDDDVLMREATIVAEARGALVRGDAAGALAAVRAAARLPVRALEPEELALEAQALRALGRDVEAVSLEATLRHRFPEHALAR